jgi:transcriptional enhancer factor
VSHLAVLHLLSPFRKPASSVSSASTGSAMSSPSSPLSDGLFPSTSSSRHIVMYIDILPDGSPDRTESGRSSSPWSDNGDVIRASDHPRRLQSINPTISFTSLSPLVAHSRFTVYSEDLILHAETVPLAAVVDHAPHAGLLYTTKLVPKYWQVLLDSPGAWKPLVFPFHGLRHIL